MSRKRVLVLLGLVVLVLLIIATQTWTAMSNLGGAAGVVWFPVVLIAGVLAYVTFTEEPSNFRRN